MVSEVAEDKRRLRRALGARRRAVPRGEAEAAGRAAAEGLLAEPRFAGCARIALYAALPDEIPTRPLFDALAERGIPRLLPRVLAQRGLAFCVAEHWGDLEAGPLGVLEPTADAAAVSLGPADLVVVPGVAFDAAGRRLGQGGGYYDRTFPVGTQEGGGGKQEGEGGPLLVGFAYELQLVDRVPDDSHDRRMDAIVTERCIRWARKEEG